MLVAHFFNLFDSLSPVGTPWAVTEALSIAPSQISAWSLSASCTPASALPFSPPLKWWALVTEKVKPMADIFLHSFVQQAFTPAFPCEPVSLTWATNYTCQPWPGVCLMWAWFSLEGDYVLDWSVQKNPGRLPKAKLIASWREGHSVIFQMKCCSPGIPESSEVFLSA